MSNINLHLGDCLEAMKEMPDNTYDLAIVDPPYGIGMDGGKIGKGKKLTKKNWDSSPPSNDYFLELFRVSKNQIIWGGNYFLLPISKAWIYWDKMQDGFGKTFSSGELAWTNFDFPMRQIRYKWQGNYFGFENSISTKSSNSISKIHPTQKPVKLYEWILDNYANEGDKILDTHLGSGSIALACHNRGFELDAWEIDEEYYNNAVERLDTHRSQLTIFDLGG